MKDYIDINDPDVISLAIGSDASSLRFRVCAKIQHLVGDQVEPQEAIGETGSFVYFNGMPRPGETYVIYILNKKMFEFLAGVFEKEISGLHIHECVNTDGDMICWPGKIETIEEAKDVLKKWSLLVGALLLSKEAGDLNQFAEIYKDSEGDWGDKAIKDSGLGAVFLDSQDFE